MPIWDGDVWECDECEAKNAVLRNRCRFCGVERHPDVDIQNGVAADAREGRAADRVAGL